MKIAIKKSDRRIKHLTNILQRPYPNTLQNVLVIFESKNYHNRKLYLELFELIEKKGIDVRDFKQYNEWASDNWKKHYPLVNYGAMPRPLRKDNKTYINIGGSSFDSNPNKIRYPKKCRKTAWKRFYKLFPHLLIDTNVTK